MQTREDQLVEVEVEAFIRRAINHRRKRPMRPPLRALFDPTRDRLCLRRRQRTAFRRHARVRITARDPREQFAFIGLSSHYRDMPTLEQRLHAPRIGKIQPSHFTHAAVTAKAIRREQW